MGFRSDNEKKRFNLDLTKVIKTGIFRKAYIKRQATNEIVYILANKVKAEKFELRVLFSYNFSG